MAKDAYRLIDPHKANDTAKDAFKGAFWSNHRHYVISPDRSSEELFGELMSHIVDLLEASQDALNETYAPFGSKQCDLMPKELNSEVHLRQQALYATEFRFFCH